MSSVTSELTAMQTATAQNKYKEMQKDGPSQELDGDAFLYLMMEQLKQQDPTNPMDNSQMLAQQAAFSQVQELQNLSKEMSQNNMIIQATGLVGKNVTVIDPNDTSKTITGKVDSANFTSSSATVVVGGVEYPLGLVMSVGDNLSTSGISGTPTDNDTIRKTKLGDLNNISGLTSGAMTLRVQDASGFVKNNVIQISRDMTVEDLVKQLNVAGAEAELKNGKIVVSPKNESYSIAIIDGDYTDMNAKATNFVTRAGFEMIYGDSISYGSKILDVQSATN